MTERTLFIVKPDAFGRRVLGRILTMIEENGLTVVAGRVLQLTPGEAERFYAVHRERGFFQDLVRFMTSGPVFVGVLEGDGAIAKWRQLMGPTDTKKAPKGTVRASSAPTWSTTPPMAPTPRRQPAPRSPSSSPASISPAPPPTRQNSGKAKARVPTDPGRGREWGSERSPQALARASRRSWDATAYAARLRRGHLRETPTPSRAPRQVHPSMN